MSRRQSLEDAKRRALALGGTLEVAGEVFNRDRQKLDITPPKTPEPEPAPVDPVPQLLAQINVSIAALAARDDTAALSRVVAAMIAAMPKPEAPVVNVPPPRAPIAYRFEVTERDERGYLRAGKLTPITKG